MKIIPQYPPQKEIEIETKNNIIHSLSIPTVRVVCGRCNGTGVHVNPSIDGNGISSEQFDEDPDFRASYFAGHYDVECEECDGARVVDVLDDEFVASLEKSHPRIFKAIWRRQEAIDDHEAEVAAHRRSMESGRGGW